MSKSKILHKRKTPSVEGCIIEVPTNNILTQTRGCPLQTVYIGDYSTVEELDKAISDAVKNGQLTQKEVDSVQ